MGRIAGLPELPAATSGDADVIERVTEEPDDADENSPHAVTRLPSNARVQRAWQAAMISFLIFPPLGFYSLGLLWNLAGKHLHARPADYGRIVVSFVLSVVSILYCLLFAVGVLAVVGRVFVGRTY
jgi:hypothetical protein